MGVCQVTKFANDKIMVSIYSLADLSQQKSYYIIKGTWSHRKVI